MAKETFGDRLLELTADITDKELSNILKEKYGLAKSDELVKQWRLKHRTPNADVIIALSDYFDVPAGWLLGFDVPKSYDPDVNMICRYTGLSQRAVEALHYATLPEAEGVVSDVQAINKRTTSFINRALDHVNAVDNEDEDRRAIETIFAVMEDYVCSTGAWIEDQRTGDPMPCVTVNYGSAPPAIVTVQELLRSQLMERVRNALEALRKEHDTTVEASATRPRKQRASRRKEGDCNG